MKLSYLTKEDSNETFHQEYQKRLEQTNEHIDDIKEEIKSHKATYKQMDKELEDIKGDDKKTIPHFKKKRTLKERIKVLEEKLRKLDEVRVKYQRHESSMRSWEMMFKKLNIDLTSRKIPEPYEAEAVDPYHNHTIDPKRLKNIKRGFNLLVPSPNTPVNYDIRESKYNTDSIDQLSIEYNRSTLYKGLAAKEKVKYKDQDQKRRLDNLTKSQRFGSSVLLDAGGHTNRKTDKNGEDDEDEDAEDEDEENKEF